MSGFELFLDRNLLESLFEYNDGVLVRKIRQGKQKAGEVAGYVNTHGYHVIMINRKYYKRSRLVFMMFNNRHPIIIDHINRIRTDDRIENLRESDPSLNSANMGIKTGGKSKYKGVTITTSKTYQACVGDRYVGVFRNEKEAAIARDMAAARKFGTSAVLNFPEISVLMVWAAI